MSTAIDWSDVLSALKTQGLSQMALAALVGSSQSSLSGLACKRIPEPGYAVGSKLLALLPKHPGAADAAAYQRGVIDTIDKLAASGVLDMRAALLALVRGEE